MNNIRTINLSNTEDITAYNFSEYSSTKWVNFGKDNDYPYFLRNLYLTSPTNQAVIDNTINLATGEGVEVVNPEQNPLSNKWLNYNFPKDVVKKLISDLKLYGYAVVEIYGGTTVKYTEALKWRFDVKDDFGQINNMWYSNDWDNYTYRKNNPVKVPLYTSGTDQEISVAVVQLDKKGFDYYSPVDYNGSINYISLESEISIYHLSNIKNGLFPSFIATFIGTEFSDEQMQKIESDITKKFGGSSNTGRAIIGFASTKDEATVLETIEQPNASETYQFLTEECSRKILVGHGVTSPLLFGIREQGGGLGNNAEELQQAFYLYYESKLKHYQNYILELINRIMNGNMLYAEVKFKTYNPFSKTEATTQMNKYKQLNEIESQLILDKIENLKLKPEGTLINTKVVNKFEDEKIYKFIKASKNENIILKKFEILDNQGFRFKKDDDLVKNTSDYYFVEEIYAPRFNK